MEAAPPQSTLLLPYLELAFERTGVAMVVTNSRREIEWANAAYGALTGWSLDEVRGRNPRSFLHGPRTNGRAADRLGAALRGGQGVKACELLNYKKSGEPYWVSMFIEPILDQDGRISKYIAFEWDITARKRAELAAGASRRRLEAASRIARLAVMHHDVSTDLVHCSAAMLEWLGIPESRPDLPFAELARYVHSQDRWMLRRRYVGAVNSGGALETSFRALSPVHGEREVRCRGRLTGWDDGHHATFTLVFQGVENDR
ncbi:MAG: PAS domain-containing protein [Rubrivivax sp.]